MAKGPTYNADGEIDQPARMGQQLARIQNPAPDPDRLVRLSWTYSWVCGKCNKQWRSNKICGGCLDCGHNLSEGRLRSPSNANW